MNCLSQCAASLCSVLAPLQRRANCPLPLRTRPARARCSIPRHAGLLKPERVVVRNLFGADAVPMLQKAAPGVEIVSVTTLAEAREAIAGARSDRLLRPVGVRSCRRATLGRGVLCRRGELCDPTGHEGRGIAALQWPAPRQPDAGGRHCADDVPDPGPVPEPCLPAAWRVGAGLGDTATGLWRSAGSHHAGGGPGGIGSQVAKPPTAWACASPPPATVAGRGRLRGLRGLAYEVWTLRRKPMWL